MKGRTNERSMQQSYRNRLYPKPSSKIFRTRVNTIVDFIPGVDVKKVTARFSDSGSPRIAQQE